MQSQNSVRTSPTRTHSNTVPRPRNRLQLHPISLADRDWVMRITQMENSRSADFNFGNLFLWAQTYCSNITQFGGRLIIQYHKDGIPCFSCPVGQGPLESAITAMQEYADAHSFPFLLRGITADYKERLEQLFPDCFRFTADIDSFDYVYETEQLATLRGKKLHSKRNHVNRFEAEHQWEFVPLTPELLPACRTFLQEWTKHRDADLPEERMALDRAFQNFEALELEGGALFVGSEMVGFTIGEPTADDTFDVHFEKARSDINGAYSMVNREFVRQIQRLHPEILYINREEDMGLENLRLAKQSYHPVFQVEKYTAQLCSDSLIQ